jgi:hypothetical protein
VAFVLGIPCLLASPWLPPPWNWIVWGLWGFYLALAVGFGARAAARAGWALLPGIVVAFAVTHAGLGAGYLRGRLTPAPRSG